MSDAYPSSILLFAACFVSFGSAGWLNFSFLEAFWFFFPSGPCFWSNRKQVEKFRRGNGIFYRADLSSLSYSFNYFFNRKLHTEPFLFWPFLDFYSLLNVVNWKTHVNMWTFTLYRGWQKQTGGLNWCRVDCLPLPLVEYVWGCGIQFQKILPALTQFFCLLPIPISHFHMELQFLMMFMLEQFHGSFFLKKWVNLIRHDTTQAIYYPFFLQWWGCFNYVWTYDFVRDLICIFLSRRMSLFECSSSCLYACGVMKKSTC